MSEIADKTAGEFRKQRSKKRYTVKWWILSMTVLMLLTHRAGGSGFAADEPSRGQAAPEGVVEIREKMFIAQTLEIYLNAEDYLGKTIRYQGFFDRMRDELTGETYRYVIRNGPGCCPGVDNVAGFEVFWEKDGSWPEPNDWVEVTGVLESCEADGEKYLRVRLLSLNVLGVRGADYVEQ
ncbi:MAG: hypothetical protein LBO82_00535 [Synergistaceae bacterium]|jgi:uncharacterized membrane protein YcgQ (UPF0703/DUF1980 family)|nr:hypothetical protein [Synergistaceae bacterium]